MINSSFLCGSTVPQIMERLQDQRRTGDGLQRGVLLLSGFRVLARELRGAGPPESSLGKDRRVPQWRDGHSRGPKVTLVPVCPQPASLLQPHRQRCLETSWRNRPLPRCPQNSGPQAPRVPQAGVCCGCHLPVPGWAASAPLESRFRSSMLPPSGRQVHAAGSWGTCPWAAWRASPWSSLHPQPVGIEPRLCPQGPSASPRPLDTRRGKADGLPDRLPTPGHLRTPSP